MIYKRCLIVFCVTVAALCSHWLYGRSSPTNFSKAAAGVVMRQIGHQLLLACGDDTSRILPVEQVADNEFHISFESPFSFHPDTLIAIVSRNLAGSALPGQYVVNVLSCNKKEVIYGYAGDFTNNNKNNTVAASAPCRGRIQPLACYQIQILFSEPPAGSNSGLLWGAGASLLVITGTGLWWNRKRRQPINSSEALAPPAQPVPVGSYLFYPHRQCLLYQQQEITLTGKETKLLTIFTRHLNELISRDQLQKEGWEEEGVITGRSLDMYVSKLRRHLQHDVSLKLVNVHGRGYKLETGDNTPLS